ncbi:hypothetical protein SXFG_00115 [Synechococcus phage S-CAM8]|uniref:Uncharacterized protein n=2 Tax=Synechococcus phage S-CAM8 TaxID=754038 RepID=G8EXX5_9CAUD|nr:hypothetical protein SXFG_00115 [Synechococcus phage S-CAM8]
MEGMEDINPEDYIHVDMSKDGLYLTYKSVCFYLEKWPGGDPYEQEALVMLRNSLMRILLEQQFRKP